MKSIRATTLIATFFMFSGAMGDTVQSKSLNDVSPPPSSAPACSESPRARPGMRCRNHETDEWLLESFSMPGTFRRAPSRYVSQANSVWLGVKLSLLKSQLREQLGVARGILIAEVLDSGPANSAGLEQGDVIVSADDRNVELPVDFAEALSKYAPGHTVTIGLIRSGERMQKQVVLAAKPDFPERIFTTQTGDLIQ